MCVCVFFFFFVFFLLFSCKCLLSWSWSQPIRVILSQSAYLTTLLPGRLSPLSDSSRVKTMIFQPHCTFHPNCPLLNQMSIHFFFFFSGKIIGNRFPCKKDLEISSKPFLLLFPESRPWYLIQTVSDFFKENWLVHLDSNIKANFQFLGNIKLWRMRKIWYFKMSSAEI